MSALRLGTRRSALATAQSGWVADRIRALTGVDVGLCPVSTEGDRTAAPLSSLGGTGVFVSALRDALLAGEVDLAVHSLKDLPTAPADGLVLAAVPVREDPRDALVARDALTLATLPVGSRLGTGSPRRAAQLRALGIGLEVIDIRGNVDTRIAMVTDGRLDAVLLARAGLVRLGRTGDITEVLDPDLVLPAPGQGALAVECRADDLRTRALLGGLDHLPSRVAVTAERALLAALQAGCAAPLGALAELDDTPQPHHRRLRLTGVVAAPDGSVVVRRHATAPLGSDPEATAHRLGTHVADRLVDGGAAELVPRPLALAATARPETAILTAPTTTWAREGEQ